ncbi:MAG: N-acetylmuramoyl-L-alanine amidase [Actinomycetales bacterium]
MSPSLPPRSDSQGSGAAHPKRGLTRRAALGGMLAGLGTAAGATAAHADERTLKKGIDNATPAPARSLESIVDEAAARFGVPGEVISAVGWNESRLEGRGGMPSLVNGFGIMHLVDNPSQRTLAEAAALTGLSELALRTEDAANVLGGAALLRARADARGLTATDRESLSAWMPVTADYSGARDQQVAQLYAGEVATTLAVGISSAGIVLKPKGAIPWSRLGVGIEGDPGTTPTTFTTPVSNPEPIGSTMPAVTSTPAYSGNYTAANRPNDYGISYIIVHVTQGSYGSAINWFQNASARVSAHYVIRSSDGKVAQCVDNSDVAWHAGNRTYNYASIGIEHEGFISQSSWFTDAMYRSSAALVSALCDQYGIPKTRSRILGHNEVPGATHTDPGPYWNWSKYMSYVTAGSLVPSWQLVLDNNSPEFSASGAWLRSDWNNQKWGGDYRYATAESVSDAAWFGASLPADGRYVIECRYPADPAYNELVPYVIATPAGNEVVYVDQTHLGGQWRSLGTYTLKAGYAPVVGVSRWAKGTGYVIADAIRISKVG